MCPNLIRIFGLQFDILCTLYSVLCIYPEASFDCIQNRLLQIIAVQTTRSIPLNPHRCQYPRHQDAFQTTLMTTRAASHAGSWYSDHGPTLSSQLDGWLSKVDKTIKDVGTIPQPGARVIIAPWVSLSPKD